MPHCCLFLFPLTLSSALNSFIAVGVATLSTDVSSASRLPLHDCSLHQTPFLLAVKSSQFHVPSCCQEISTRSRGKLALPTPLHPTTCPFSSVHHSVCSPFSLSYTTLHLSVLHSSPNLKPTPLPLHEVDGPYLCSGKQSFAAAVLLFSARAFLLLICCPSHLSALSSFLVFFPISCAQMRCCVQRRVCTFLIASSCPGIRWWKWACNETEYCCANTHPPGL